MKDRSKTAKAVRKLLAALVGFPILIVGLILIPLPGPGVLVCALGLLILSTEFDWAKRHLDKAKAWLQRAIAKSKPSSDKNKS